MDTDFQVSCITRNSSLTLSSAEHNNKWQLQMGAGICAFLCVNQNYGVCIMAKQELKIGQWIQAGFNIYKENFLLLLVVNLLAGILSMVTLGLLAGPMVAGVILIQLRLLDKSEPKPEIGDLFKGFDFFLDSFLLVLANIVVSIIASLLAHIIFSTVFASLFLLVFNILLSVLFVFSMFYIVDKKMDCRQAVVTAFKALLPVFLPAILMVIIAEVISVVGILLFIVGIIVTFPLQISVLSVVYQDLLRSPAQAE